ncbi:MAG TPA: OsmC family protein [Fimbriimonas sp.]
MATANHEYRVSANWDGGRDGKGSLNGTYGTIDLRTPPEFGGPGGAANPEELLTSAIAACYAITFGIIATNRKIPYTALHVDAVGNVKQEGPSFTYDRITIRPKITLAPEATPEQETMAKEMAHKADAYCIITNAVRGKVEVQVEPEIVRG